MALLAERNTAQSIDTPAWVWPVIAACTDMTEPASCAFSAVAISGSIPSGAQGKRLLRRLVEELAEKYDLQVTLDVGDTTFAANFSAADH